MRIQWEKRNKGKMEKRNSCERQLVLCQINTQKKLNYTSLSFLFVQPLDFKSDPKDHLKVNGAKLSFLKDNIGFFSYKR